MCRHAQMGGQQRSGQQRDTPQALFSASAALSLRTRARAVPQPPQLHTTAAQVLARVAHLVRLSGAAVGRRAPIRCGAGLPCHHRARSTRRLRAAVRDALLRGTSFADLHAVHLLWVRLKGGAPGDVMMAKRATLARPCADTRCTAEPRARCYKTMRAAASVRSCARDSMHAELYSQQHARRSHKKRKHSQHWWPES